MDVVALLFLAVILFLLTIIFETPWPAILALLLIVVVLFGEKDSAIETRYTCDDNYDTGWSTSFKFIKAGMLEHDMKYYKIPDGVLCTLETRELKTEE